ncbi:MAG: hydrogenase maturation nickel metallochaperone HypA [Roseburia sp.]
MHELGIIVHVAKSLEGIAAENKLEKIGSVTLEIGEVSGVVPEYLTDCWEYYRKRVPILAESEMKIEMLPAVTFCEHCEKTYETVKHGRTCPYCGSGETYLVAGNECNIKEIEAC